MEMQYLAKYNKVWQNIRSGGILGNKLTLNPGEKITDYRQIIKKEACACKSAKKTKKQQENI